MELKEMNIFGTPRDSKEIIIYHGNPRKTVAQYGKGKHNNDYGLGFYCTEDEYQAKLWALASNGKGYVYKYRINTSELKVLNLDDNNGLLWISILISNRKLYDLSEQGKINRELLLSKYLTVNVEEYDIITGYRADDSYFMFSQAFLEGSLSYEYLMHALKVGKLGHQFVLKSKKAFNKLHLVSENYFESEKLRKEFLVRDKIARTNYKDFEKRCAYDKVRLKDKFNDIYKFI